MRFTNINETKNFNKCKLLIVSTFDSFLLYLASIYFFGCYDFDKVFFNYITLILDLNIFTLLNFCYRISPHIVQQWPTLYFAQNTLFTCLHIVMLKVELSGIWRRLKDPVFIIPIYCTTSGYDSDGTVIKLCQT